jgi:hypothetical protein
LKYKYVLADSCFSSKENMTERDAWVSRAYPIEVLSFISQALGKHFIMALKSNRTLVLSEEDKKQGRFIRIDSLNWSEPISVKGWLKGLDFPVLIHRQVLTNKDGSIGILYLACSDLNCSVPQIETVYQKQWKVEVFHSEVYPLG